MVMTVSEGVLASPLRMRATTGADTDGDGVLQAGGRQRGVHPR